MANTSGLHKTTSTSEGGDPSSHKLGIKIFSSNGKERDITALVSKVIVTESIYQQALMAEFDITDGINMMEDLNITGNEKITMVLRKQIKEGEEAADLQSDWYILDIPLYGRPKPDIQVYKIRCISTFGFISKLKKVEHVLKGTPVEILEELYRENNIEGEKLDVKDTSSAGIMTYIPPKISYSDAISQILSKTMSDNGSPYFSYEIFNGSSNGSKVVMTSYNEMVTAEPYERYEQHFFEQGEAFTDGQYSHKRRSILEVSSNLGFSPYKALKDGAYTTRSHILDWGTKSYKLSDYNAMDNKPPLMDKDLIMHPDFNINGLSYSNIVGTHNLYYNTNALARADMGEVGIHEHMALSGNIRRSIMSNMAQLEHSVKLYGDVRLTPGTMVEIIFAKTGHAEIEETDHVDLLLSGRYLIVSSVHEFVSGGYFTRIKVRKDSIDRGKLAYNPIEGGSSPEPKELVGKNPDGPNGGLLGETKPIETIMLQNNVEEFVEEFGGSSVITGTNPTDPNKEEEDLLDEIGGWIDTYLGINGNLVDIGQLSLYTGMIDDDTGYVTIKGNYSDMSGYLSDEQFLQFIVNKKNVLSPDESLYDDGITKNWVGSWVDRFIGINDNLVDLEKIKNYDQLIDDSGYVTFEGTLSVMNGQLSDSQFNQYLVNRAKLNPPAVDVSPGLDAVDRQFDWYSIMTQEELDYYSGVVDENGQYPPEPDWNDIASRR